MFLCASRVSDLVAILFQTERNTLLMNVDHYKELFLDEKKLYDGRVVKFSTSLLQAKNQILYYQAKVVDLQLRLDPTKKADLKRALDQDADPWNRTTQQAADPWNDDPILQIRSD
jgi:hypothetical protein